MGDFTVSFYLYINSRSTTERPVCYAVFRTLHNNGRLAHRTHAPVPALERLRFQTLMDSQSCKHAVLVKDTCEQYAGCYTNKLKAFQIARTTVIMNERDRKAEWRGLTRIACLIAAFADAQVSSAVLLFLFPLSRRPPLLIVGYSGEGWVHPPLQKVYVFVCPSEVS